MPTIQHPVVPDQKRMVSDDQLQDWLAQGWVKSDEEIEPPSTKTSAEEFIEEQAAQDDDQPAPVPVITDDAAEGGGVSDNG